MPRYICVYGYHRIYAYHSVERTIGAMLQVHVRVVFLYGRQMERSFDVQRLANGTSILMVLTNVLVGLYYVLWRMEYKEILKI